MTRPMLTKDLRLACRSDSSGRLLVVDGRRSANGSSALAATARGRRSRLPDLSDTGSRWPCSRRRDRGSFQSQTTASSPPGAAAPVLAARPIVANARRFWSPDPTAIWREPCHRWCTSSALGGRFVGGVWMPGVSRKRVLGHGTGRWFRRSARESVPWGSRRLDCWGPYWPAAPRPWLTTMRGRARSRCRARRGRPSMSGSRPR
jgi:hypothetical protein